MVRARTSASNQRGGMLLAAAGVLAILALAYFALFAQRHYARRLNVGASQAARLAVIDDALAQYVARHRRLPCPANGRLVSGATGAGQASVGGNGQCNPANQQDGVVPWVDLGLSEEQASDAWLGRITYRVQPSLTSATLNLMNMSWCDFRGRTRGAPGAANACSPAPCSGANCMHPNNYLYGKGLAVQDGAGGWLNQPMPPWAGAPAPPPASTGAAYVLIAHGPNGAQAFNAKGVFQAGTSPADPDEMKNASNAALTATTIFIDKAPVTTPGMLYFDDMLSHPTLTSVLDKAVLGPRSH